MRTYLGRIGTYFDHFFGKFLKHFVSMIIKLLFLQVSKRIIWPECIEKTFEIATKSQIRKFTFVKLVTQISVILFALNSIIKGPSNPLSTNHALPPSYWQQGLSFLGLTLTHLKPLNSSPASRSDLRRYPAGDRFIRVVCKGRIKNRW